MRRDSAKKIAPRGYFRPKGRLASQPVNSEVMRADRRRALR